jgi:hypothetical protein
MELQASQRVASGLVPVYSRLHAWVWFDVARELEPAVEVE